VSPLADHPLHDLHDGGEGARLVCSSPSVDGETLTLVNARQVVGLKALGLSREMLSAVIGRHPNILGVRTETIMSIREWYIEQGVSPSKVRGQLAPSVLSLVV
jgi:hypothetical protein